ncbi:Rieske (2Fe-2S) protein [Amycolatopsis echigonensis]|uniref:Rieske (2Fe-2S) protein n=1 Tax=Amycolatopsis echigonensis TaxID=2576905 RepID=A0A8E1W7B8_9PSEU|nr:Rieske (2Fe-2S) protein [Amycolatopsis echigonensis]MBB2505161.1 Rieske (2Fe-2S) protein [Amycolatopsis echigonensis]
MGEAGSQTHVVGTVEELPPGSVRLVEVGRYGVAVYNVGGEYHALNNYCPHMGAPICAGRITGVATGEAPGHKGWSRAGEIVECPWHGWKFGIADGRSLTKPVHRIRKYSVAVRDGKVILEIAGGGKGDTQ